MTIRPDRPLGVIPPQTLASHSGLDLFAKMIAGDLPSPPVCAVSNQWITAVEKGRVTWTCSPPPNFINPMGGVHGGWAMTVLDSTLACAVHSGLPAGRGYTTVEVKTNLTRAPKVGETYTCVGELITLGRSIGTSEAKLIDAEGRMVAFGTTTCLIMGCRGDVQPRSRPDPATPRPPTPRLSFLGADPGNKAATGLSSAESCRRERRYQVDHRSCRLAPNR